MPGHQKAPRVPHPNIPLKTLVRSKRDRKRWGVLVSYGSRSARVCFDPANRRGEWVTIVHLEAVPADEIAARLKQEAEDLV